MPTVQHHLTSDEMTQVKAAIDAADTPYDVLLAALTTTFNILLAGEGKTWEDFDADHKIDGKQYAIPDTQWVEIGDHLKARSHELSGDAIGTVNLTLDWMNIGPSSYTAVQA